MLNCTFLIDDNMLKAEVKPNFCFFLSESESYVSESLLWNVLNILSWEKHDCSCSPGNTANIWRQVRQPLSNVYSFFVGREEGN